MGFFRSDNFGFYFYFCPFRKRLRWIPTYRLTSTLSKKKSSINLSITLFWINRRTRTIRIVQRARCPETLNWKKLEKKYAIIASEKKNNKNIPLHSVSNISNCLDYWREKCHIHSTGYEVRPISRRSLCQGTRAKWKKKILLEGKFCYKNFPAFRIMLQS